MERPSFDYSRISMRDENSGGRGSSFPTPRALFHESDYRPPIQQPSTWPRRKEDSDTSLSKLVCDAAQRGDFAAIERVAIKLISLARQSDANAIQELAGVPATAKLLPATPDLKSLRAHSLLRCKPVVFSPFITSVGISAHGQLQADLIPSGLEGLNIPRSSGVSICTSLLALLAKYLLCCASYSSQRAFQLSVFVLVKQVI